VARPIDGPQPYIHHDTGPSPRNVKVLSEMHRSRGVTCEVLVMTVVPALLGPGGAARTGPTNDPQRHSTQVRGIDADRSPLGIVNHDRRGTTMRTAPGAYTARFMGARASEDPHPTEGNDLVAPSPGAGRRCGRHRLVGGEVASR
jgi:hypothetical protein